MNSFHVALSTIILDISFLPCYDNNKANIIWRWLMRTVYTDLNIKFTIENYTFSILNIVFEKFLRSIPRHSHGHNSYEIHYIPYGHGNVHIQNDLYQISPNTLYMTGPNVEHEQVPTKDDPMAEYCIYFKLGKRHLLYVSPSRFSLCTI